jgi:PiT family inorganic phosphate transporter
MTLGSYLFGRRVTVTLAEHTVRIDRVEGMVANGVAAALVLLASAAALPVSTTHVVGGAIVGGGLSRGRHAVHWATLRTILVAWLVTLPSSALIAGLVSAIT